MKKSFFFLLLIAFSCGHLSAQKNNNQEATNLQIGDKRLDRIGFELGFGLMIPDFQDVRFSRAQYSGGGALLSLGFRKRTADVERWVGLTFNSGEATTSLNDLALNTFLKVALAYEQQRPIGELFGAQWLVGGELRSVLEVYGSEAQGNNSSRLFTNVGLTGMSTLRFRLGKNPLNVGLGLGLLHWGKDNTSFAFSQAQHLLENGEFSYEDDRKAGPLGGYRLRTLGGVNQLRTRLGYQFGGRFTLQYDWELTRYAVVKDYPTTQAVHSFAVRYTF